jgi:hypothetical protein
VNNDIEDAMITLQDALWGDRRIAAFGMDQTNPDLTLIDLGTRDFCSPSACKTTLTKTLKRIKKKLSGHPTVYWSGRGCHIIKPIDCPVNLDTVKEFVNDGDVNKNFCRMQTDI